MKKLVRRGEVITDINGLDFPPDSDVTIENCYFRNRCKPKPITCNLQLGKHV